VRSEVYAGPTNESRLLATRLQAQAIGNQARETVRKVRGQRPTRAHPNVGAKGLPALVELAFTDHDQTSVQSAEYPPDVVEQGGKCKGAFGQVDKVRWIVGLSTRESRRSGEPACVAPENFEHLNEAGQGTVVGAQIARG
jgi:hypothetical protein